MKGLTGLPGAKGVDVGPYTLHPTLHPTPYTPHLHPTFCILHPTPYTLHPTPCTPHPIRYTLHPPPYIPHPTPYTLHPTPYTLLTGLRGAEGVDVGPELRACQLRLLPLPQVYLTQCINKVWKVNSPQNRRLNALIINSEQ